MSDERNEGGRVRLSRQQKKQQGFRKNGVHVEQNTGDTVVKGTVLTPESISRDSNSPKPVVTSYMEAVGEGTAGEAKKAAADSKASAAKEAAKEAAKPAAVEYNQEQKTKSGNGCEETEFRSEDGKAEKHAADHIAAEAVADDATQREEEETKKQIQTDATLASLLGGAVVVASSSGPPPVRPLVRPPSTVLPDGGVLPSGDPPPPLPLPSHSNVTTYATLKEAYHELVELHKQTHLKHIIQNSDRALFDLNRLWYIVQAPNKDMTTTQCRDALLWLRVAYHTTSPQDPWWLKVQDDHKNEKRIPIFTHRRSAATLKSISPGMHRYTLFLQSCRSNFILNDGISDADATKNWSSDTKNRGSVKTPPASEQKNSDDDIPTLYESIIRWLDRHCRGCNPNSGRVMVNAALPWMPYINRHGYPTSDAAGATNALYVARTSASMCEWKDAKMYIFVVLIVTHVRLQYYNGIIEHYREIPARHKKVRCPLLIPQQCVGFDILAEIGQDETLRQHLTLDTIRRWFSHCSYAGGNLHGNILHFIRGPCQPQAVVSEYQFIQAVQPWWDKEDKNRSTLVSTKIHSADKYKPPIETIQTKTEKKEEEKEATNSEFVALLGSMKESQDCQNLFIRAMAQQQNQQQPQYYQQQNQPQNQRPNQQQPQYYQQQNQPQNQQPQYYQPQYYQQQNQPQNQQQPQYYQQQNQPPNQQNQQENRGRQNQRPNQRPNQQNQQENRGRQNQRPNHQNLTEHEQIMGRFNDADAYEKYFNSYSLKSQEDWKLWLEAEQGYLRGHTRENLSTIMNNDWYKNLKRSEKLATPGIQETMSAWQLLSGDIDQYLEKCDTETPIRSNQAMLAYTMKEFKEPVEDLRQKFKEAQENRPRRDH
jgi:hypothetical protein